MALQDSLVPRSPAAAEGDEDQKPSQSTLALLAPLQLQLQLQLIWVALASAEQRSRARGQGAHVRAQGGWASSRWAPAPGWRGPGLAAKQDARADKAPGEQRRARRRACGLPWQAARR
ncbi:hypothetical protein [Metallibacterium sp.]